ncbi:MAG: 50S ribosomal protein L3 [Planctomycetes bacterium]|nr:50S ribosomal protein L3 [Planctomycetota bacterium]
MIRSLLGKKIGMTQVFNEDGAAIPVTVIEAGPCPVVQIRKKDVDGYTALQLGFDRKRERSVIKPEKGHFATAGVEVKKVLREVEWNGSGDVTPGQPFSVDIFANTDLVNVQGVTKGKGFQGVVRRWGFHGGPATHGQSDRERAPGSLGRQHSISQGVYPGKKMGGHMGNVRRTIRHLQVVRVDKDRNLLLLRGAVPGANGGTLLITSVREKGEHHAATVESKKNPAKSKAKAAMK